MDYPRTAAAIKALASHSHTGRDCDLCRALLERTFATWRSEGGSSGVCLATIRVECSTGASKPAAKDDRKSTALTELNRFFN